MRKLALAGAALTLLVAGCGGGGSAPPSARSLALKVPGCHKPYTPAAGVAVQARQEQECITPYAEVDVATFGSDSSERSWLTAQGAGCECVRGGGWAASVMVTSGGFAAGAQKVARALGGTRVQV